MKMERDMLIGAGKLSSKGTFVSPSKKGDAENPDLRMSIASLMHWIRIIIYYSKPKEQKIRIDSKSIPFLLKMKNLL